ncbi:MAG: flagellar motor protein MotB [Alphaproteobacteria bacterium]|nr:flagellar motor protein MotB [Alphaproteobacteria bacterium]
MAKDEKGKEELQPIIKKIKKGDHGHHGGAWKVAYADFVTAMMAFFLLLWLLNVTTEEQKTGIANYFDPQPQVSSEISGAGGLLAGQSFSVDGARVSEMDPVVNSPDPTMDPNPAADPKEQSLEDASDKQLQEEMTKREEQKFDELKQKIEETISSSSELKDLAKNVVIDVTDEGLRIQIVDQEGEPMFPSGSAQMYEKTRKLMEAVADIIKTVPNAISMRGHTDGNAYRGGANYTNWELSADRANASRRVLADKGVSEKRLANVVGKADTDHFMKDAPSDPRNRRISIILLRQAGSSSEQGGSGLNTTDTIQKETRSYKKSGGAVQFP